MTALLESVTYGVIVDGKKYLIENELNWDKHYPTCKFWETYINGEMKPHRWKGDMRFTMPSKSEIIKHIESYYYPSMEDESLWHEEKKVWKNPIFTH